MHPFNFIFITFYICACFWKHYAESFNFLIIVCVTNKLFIILFTWKNHTTYLYVINISIFFLRELDFYDEDIYIFSISVLTYAIISCASFIHNKKNIISYNDPLFLLKSTFCCKFTALLLLILLTIWGQSTSQMFKIQYR